MTTVVDHMSTDPLITGWADPAVGLAEPRPTTPASIASVVRKITVVLTEVLVGARPTAQIARWLGSTEHADLVRWRTAHPGVRISSVRAHTRHPEVSQTLVQISWRSTAGQLSAVVDLAVDDVVRCRRVVLLLD